MYTKTTPEIHREIVNILRSFTPDQVDRILELIELTLEYAKRTAPGQEE